MAFNLLYYNANDDSLTKADSTAVDDLAEYLLEIVADAISNGSLLSFHGTIQIGTDNPIGTFTDTARAGDVGDSDTTIVSNTYTLSQSTNKAFTNISAPPNYLGLDTSNSDTVVIQESLTSLEDLADEIIDRMVNNDSYGGPNSYFLGTTAPSTGTWVSLGSILDTIENLTVTETDSQLWYRIDSSVTINDVKRPIKLTTSGELQSFSDSDIDNILKIVEDRIASTGIGTYVLQENSPTNGTWLNVGSTLTDTRRTTESATYTGTQSVSYTGTNTYAGNYLGNYTGSSSTSYTGNYVGNTTYFGNYVSTFSTTYLGNYVGNPSFFGNYYRQFTGYLSGSTFYYGPGTFVGNYQANYTYFGNYVSGSVNTYTGNYVGNTTYFGNYIGSSSTSYAGNYLGNYGSNENYTGTTSADYIGSVVADSTETVSGSSVTLWRKIAE